MEQDLYSFASEQGKNLSRVADAGAGICPLGPSKKVKAAIRKEVREIGRCPDPELRGLRRFFLSKFGVNGDCVFFANSKNECNHIIESVFGLSGPRYVSNPDLITGRLSERSGLWRELLQEAEEGRMAVIDESLIEFCGNDALYEGLPACDNIIVIRTTANFYGLPGLELAWAFSSPATIRRLRDAYAGHIGVLSSAAAIAALKDGTYKKNALKFIRDERMMLFNALRKIEGIRVPGSDSNVFVIEVIIDPEKLKDRLSRAGFFVRDCAGTGGLGPGFLRLSVMTHDLNKKLLRVIKETFAPACVRRSRPAARSGKRPAAAF
ncbi:MAG: aminotransferase class I/II-fold pyridoxal phosphate-dependent enzyme [Nitrospirae bacterium]|nr:aminotransferase class I/II-fold pyridoxal phosphate-dependent enzyme [Nitrospirota bacterium]